MVLINSKKTFLYLLLVIIYSIVPYISFVMIILLRYIIKLEWIFTFFLIISIILACMLYYYEKYNIIVGKIKYHMISNYILIFHTVFINISFVALLFELCGIHMIPNIDVYNYFMTVLILNIYNIYNISYNIKLCSHYNKNFSLLYRTLILIIQIILPVYNIILSLYTFKNKNYSNTFLLIYWISYFIIVFLTSLYIYRSISFISWI